MATGSFYTYLYKLFSFSYFLGLNIIDPLRKKSSAHSSAANGASGLGGATNLDGDVGNSWKSPFLLARERRGHLGSGSGSARYAGGETMGGATNLGGGEVDLSDFTNKIREKVCTYVCSDI